MSEPRDWDLLAKYLSHEASPDEVRDIQSWIESDPENERMVERLRASLTVLPAHEDATDLNAMWNRIAAGMRRSEYETTSQHQKRSLLGSIMQVLSPRPGWSLKPVMLTALASIAVVALVWNPFQTFWSGPEMISVHAPLGQTVSVDLQDGSRVVLDAGSELRHPLEFTGGSRLVILKGQAYFRVQHDESRPFRVIAGTTTVEVLGTAFEVTSWDRASATVTVEEGRVRFGRSDALDEKTVVLTADQMSQLNADGYPSTPARVDASRRLAWLRHEVYFDDVPLADVLDRLHRWYDVRITVSESALLKEHVTVHLVKPDLQGSLELVGRILGMEAVRENGGYRFARRGNGVN